MKKVILYVSDRDQQEGSDLLNRVKDALNHSSNFLDSHVLEDYTYRELPVGKMSNTSEDIIIECPCCDNWEAQPVDQQRHHLQTFNLKAWCTPVGETERSLMTCEACKSDFITLWDYTEDEDLEEREWDYACSSDVIWGSFDYGTVTAKTEEEAKTKAIAEIKQNLEAINARLEVIGQRVEINLDCLEVTETD